jgi:hypothetical protein
MHGMTLEQLRTSVQAGGVRDVTLRGKGGSFLVEIGTDTDAVVLVKARTTEPRRFRTPTSAMMVLRGVGIDEARLDARDWDPTRKDLSRARDSRAEAMRRAHRAAAHADWLAGEIAASIDDPRPSISHDVVMADLEADLAALPG